MSRLEPYLRELAERDREARISRGIQVYVSQHGEPLADFAFGTRGQDDQELTPTTRMHCYSSSKPVAATALHVLVGRGLVDYDDMVVRYLPEYGKHGKETTAIRDLLTHRAGIPSWNERALPLSTYFDIASAAAVLANLQPETPPGLVSVYHPVTAYTIVAAIVQVVAAEAFGPFCEREILERLGMLHTTWGLPQAAEREVSDTYALDAADEAIEASWRTRKARAAVIPSGGLYGTARDLGRFYEAWLSDDGLQGLLPASLVKRICCLVHPVAPGAGWGLGFWVGRQDGPDGRGSLLSRATFGHPGLHSVQTLADPDRGVVVALMASSNPGLEVSNARFDEWCDLICRGLCE